MEKKIITVNGTPVSEYTLVHKADDKTATRLAAAIRDMIEDICGCKLNVIDDTNAYGGGKEILVGFSTRIAEKGAAADFGAIVNALGDKEYVIYGNGNFVYLGGKEGDKNAAVSASGNFVKLVAADNSADLSDKTAKTAKVTPYRVMSYNDGDNATTKTDQVSVIIRDCCPDIIGMQEVRDIHAPIYEQVAPGYKAVYYDTNDRYHIGGPILYRADKFELVESGSQFLSPTPDIPFTIFEETAWMRNYEYAILKDKETGDQLVAINTHIDYVPAAIVKQVGTLLKLTERFKNMPVLYTADWNTAPDTPGYNMMQEKYFADSRLMADKLEDASTCNGYIIDFLFASILYTTVDHYRVINDHEYSDTASDHYPILIDLKIVR